MVESEERFGRGLRRAIAIGCLAVIPLVAGVGIAFVFAKAKAQFNAITSPLGETLNATNKAHRGSLSWSRPPVYRKLAHSINQQAAANLMPAPAVLGPDTFSAPNVGIRPDLSARVTHHTRATAGPAVEMSGRTLSE